MTDTRILLVGVELTVRARMTGKVINGIYNTTILQVNKHFYYVLDDSLKISHDL